MILYMYSLLALTMLACIAKMP